MHYIGQGTCFSVSCGCVQNVGTSAGSQFSYEAYCNFSSKNSGNDGHASRDGGIGVEEIQRFPLGWAGFGVEDSSCQVGGCLLKESKGGLGVRHLSTLIGPPCVNGVGPS